ncbi:MAG: hypothetical protein NTZ05_01465 [Chloroflexi bacterium]|nr:hypothetical protein [Chloroflexota bacterium]
MPSFSVELTEEDAQQLAALAAGREMEPAALLQRWARERLAHERERAEGGGRDMSPRARRERLE